MKMKDVNMEDRIQSAKDRSKQVRAGFSFEDVSKDMVDTIINANGVKIDGEYKIEPAKRMTELDCVETKIGIIDDTHIGVGLSLNLPFDDFIANYAEGARPLTKRKEDAGFDVYPLFEDGQLTVTIKPHQTVIFKTGIRTAFPSNYYIHLEERGSTGVIGLSQRAGVIDSGYRGEWMIPVTNTNDIPVVVSKLPKDSIDSVMSNYIYYPYSKAICQAVLHRCEHTEFRSVSAEDIDSVASERGIGKLGSSGK